MSIPKLGDPRPWRSASIIVVLRECHAASLSSGTAADPRAIMGRVSLHRRHGHAPVTPISRDQTRLLDALGAGLHGRPLPSTVRRIRDAVALHGGVEVGATPGRMRSLLRLQKRARRGATRPTGGAGRLSPSDARACCGWGSHTGEAARMPREAICGRRARAARQRLSITGLLRPERRAVLDARDDSAQFAKNSSPKKKRRGGRPASKRHDRVLHRPRRDCIPGRLEHESTGPTRSSRSSDNSAPPRLDRA
jgi:hypothetical protein